VKVDIHYRFTVQFDIDLLMSGGEALMARNCPSVALMARNYPSAAPLGSTREATNPSRQTTPHPPSRPLCCCLIWPAGKLVYPSRTVVARHLRVPPTVFMGDAQDFNSRASADVGFSLGARPHMSGVLRRPSAFRGNTGTFKKISTQGLHPGMLDLGL
jgi:hypothetical protein